VSASAESVAACSLRWFDFMLDAGDCPPGPTSMVDCTGAQPVVLRQGFQPVEL
jgi:tRNA A37 threonylcarbamoyladenosine synthetase subunit TsaC/SUA5/YrdC